MLIAYIQYVHYAVEVVKILLQSSEESFLLVEKIPEDRINPNIVTYSK